MLDGQPSGASAAGSPGTGGTAAGAGGIGAGGTGASVPACHELDPEPNDDRSSPISRETLSDCDIDATTLTGTLAGDDVDVWQFSVADTFGCLVNPTIEADEVLRVCVSASCTGSQIDCAQGFYDGLDGCCALGPGAAELAIDCEGASDSLTAWFSVEQDWTIPISGRDCLDYSVSVHF